MNTLSDVPYCCSLLRSLSLCGFLLSLEYPCPSGLQAFVSAMPQCGMATSFPILKNILPSFKAYFKCHLLCEDFLHYPQPEMTSTVPSPALGHYSNTSPMHIALTCASCPLLALLSISGPSGRDLQIPAVHEQVSHLTNLTLSFFMCINGRIIQNHLPEACQNQIQLKFLQVTKYIKHIRHYHYIACKLMNERTAKV